MSSAPLELGHGHVLHWLSWSPDDALNPQYADRPILGPGERFGARLEHSSPDGKPCDGSIVFNTELFRYLVAKFNHRDVAWNVLSWKPLTIAPSVLCKCGDHGFIVDGRWVVA